MCKDCTGWVRKKKRTSSERPLPPEFPSNTISVVISSNSRHYRVFEKKCNPLLFKILQKIIRFESIWGIPPECTIYVLSNGIQVEWINWIFHCLIDVFASTAYFRCRNVIGNLHRRQSTFVRAYFYHYLQIHLMTLKLSFSIHKACITSSASRPEILWKHVFYNFWQEKGVCSNGMLHLKLTNLMINNSINVSKLHIIRQKKDCTFRWYTLRLPKFCHFLKILNHWVAFFLKHPVDLWQWVPCIPVVNLAQQGLIIKQWKTWPHFLQSWLRISIPWECFQFFNRIDRIENSITFTP